MARKKQHLASAVFTEDDFAIVEKQASRANTRWDYWVNEAIVAAARTPMALITHLEATRYRRKTFPSNRTFTLNEPAAHALASIVDAHVGLARAHLIRAAVALALSGHKPLSPDVVRQRAETIAGRMATDPAFRARITPSFRLATLPRTVFLQPFERIAGLASSDAHTVMALLFSNAEARSHGR